MCVCGKDLNNLNNLGVRSGDPGNDIINVAGNKLDAKVDIFIKKKVLYLSCQILNIKVVKGVKIEGSEERQ